MNKEEFESVFVKLLDNQMKEGEPIPLSKKLTEIIDELKCPAVDLMDLCHNCRIKLGYKRKDKGAHTARLMICDGCAENKSVLPGRHWVKVVGNDL